MPDKNYYTILELSPSASYDEIRKSFRRLAVKYHPDKNPGNPEAEAAFKELQEAHSVLTHPEQRKRYDERRWYSERTRPAAREEEPTGASLHRRTAELLMHVEALDPAFIDKEALSQYMLKYLVGKKSLEILGAESEPFRRLIIPVILRVMRQLTYPQAEAITGRLLTTPNISLETTELIHKSLREQKRIVYWKKYQGFVVLLLTLLICWLIYYNTR